MSTSTPIRSATALALKESISIFCELSELIFFGIYKPI